MRYVLPLISAAAFTLLAPVLHAEECPKGDWFCEPAPGDRTPPPRPTPEPAEPERAPRADEPGGDRWSEPEPRRRERIVLEPQEDFSSEEYAPPPEVDRRYRLRLRPRRVRRHFREWGVDVNGFGAIMGNDRAMSSSAGMGGLGFGLRYRPLHEFRLDFDVQLGFGTDYNGYDRQETAFLLNGVGIFNPRSVVRAYVFGGFGLSSAQVRVSNNSTFGPAYNDTYTYIGLDAGLGAEVRVTPRIGIHVDLMGFIRSRTDADRSSRPEFVDAATGRSTDTSGAGLLRLGVAFYW